MIAFVSFTSKHFFKNLKLGMVSMPIFRQLMRDGELIPRGSGLFLQLSFIMGLSVLIYQIDIRFPFINFPAGLKAGTQTLYIFALLVLMELSKTIVMFFLGFIFKLKNHVKDYLTNNIFTNVFMTILLIPMLLFSVYSKSWIILYSAITVAFGLFIFRLVRSLILAFEVRKYSGFQIFLYLCALEILPVFILIKILTVYISVI